MDMKQAIAVFLSRKFLGTLFALFVVIGFQLHTECLVEQAPVEKASHFVTMFMTTSGTIAAILIGYLGFNTLQTKFGLSGVAQVMASTASEKIEETRRIEEVNESRAKHDDDYA